MSSKRNKNIPSKKSKTNKQELYLIKLREEAQCRQSAYDKLTITQKLHKLDLGGFVAKRQRGRLNKGLEK